MVRTNRLCITSHDVPKDKTYAGSDMSVGTIVHPEQSYYSTKRPTFGMNPLRLWVVPVLIRKGINYNTFGNWAMAVPRFWPIKLFRTVNLVPTRLN